MFKFICILTLVIFGGAGIVLLFSDVEREAPAPVIAPVGGGKYDMLADNSSSLLSSLAERIGKQCEGGNKECVAVALHDYLKKNFTVKEDETLEPLLWKVIREGKGDKREIAMLFESLLASSGIDAVTKEQDGVLKIYACNLDILSLYEELRKNMRTKALAAREITLDKNGVWAVDLKSKNNAPLAVDIVGEGSGSFDVLVFPSDGEMRDYIKGLSANYSKECFKSEVSNIDLRCFVPSGSRLAIISRQDGNVIKGAVFRGGFLLNDIKTVQLGGKTCVDMDIDF